mgnify:CR=1 FL=1
MGRVTNFFDLPPDSDDAPAAGEDEYGNVVPLKKRRKKEVMLGEGWRAEWQISDAGTPLPNLFNVMVALRRYDRLREIVSFDEMQRKVVINHAAPGATSTTIYPRFITDADVMTIQEELQRQGLRRIAKATVQDALDLRAMERPYHPVRDYLESLEWDKTPRVEKWLSYYLGAEDSPYVRTIGRLFLVALIARIMRPGCKADYMLILEGPQGAMKSSACHALAGEWFSDNLPDLSKGDAVRLSMHLRGKWLIEIAEMSSFNAAESHTLKEFLTQTEERYIPKYSRQEVHEPRQCLFIGTTNEGAYLRDATGGRRFWPVKVGRIDLDALRHDRDQILAEAVQLFRDNAKWWPDREFEQEHIAPQQEERFEEDVWETEIAYWLVDQSVRSCTISQAALGALKLEASKIGTREQRRIGACLTRLGWRRAARGHGGVRIWEKSNG